jgi:hypothetical protein
MQNKAHVRARLRAQAPTHTTNPAPGVRGNELSPRAPRSNQLIARWVPSANGGLEMRWEPRFERGTLVTLSGGARA